MKVVVLTMRLFDRPQTGGELCTARLLRGLEAAGHEVIVMGRGEGPAQPAPRMRFVSLGEPMPAFDDLPAAQRWAHPLGALLCRRPVTTQRMSTAGADRRARAQLAALRGQFDALIVDHLQSLAWLGDALAGMPAPMVIMHNLESDGYRERARNVPAKGLIPAIKRWLLQREAHLLGQLEGRALRQARVVGCLSEPDAQRLRALCRTHDARAVVEVLPGYTLRPDTAPLRLPPAPAPLPAAGTQALQSLPSGARRIGMVGTWTWEPNRAGLDWMLQRVMPHLPDDCYLVLAGGGLERVPVPPRVLVLGRIADVAALYSAVDVVAIPSVRGSGVHEKAIEAIGAGLTVVATTHALRGLMADLPAHVHVADSPEAFAQRCAQVMVPACGSTADAGGLWVAKRAALYRQALDRCLALCARPAAGLAPAQAHAAPRRLAPTES